MQYWIRGTTGIQGPFDQLQIRGLVATGQLTPAMELSSDQTTWHVASRVRGLFPMPEPKPILDFATADGALSQSASQPVQAPAHSATTPVTAKSTPLGSSGIWNPVATVNWSLLFTPIFGSYLQSKNWQTLGQESSARTSRIWFWVSIVVVAVVAFAPIPEKVAGGLALWLLILWYLFAARKQITFVRTSLGQDYARRSFGKPIGIGVGVFLLTIIAGGVIDAMWG